MKELNDKIVTVLVFGYLLLISCNNSKQNSNTQSDISSICTYIKLHQNIEDTLSKYLSGISDSCEILIKADRSYIYKTLRLNVIPIPKTEIKVSSLLFTTVNDRKVFINTGIEDYLTSQVAHEIINCDDNIFVLYDSSGVISVIENLNDFDDDLRPSQQLVLRLNVNDN